MLSPAQVGTFPICRTIIDTIAIAAVAKTRGPVIVAGRNGDGKTTFVAKIAKKLSRVIVVRGLRAEAELYPPNVTFMAEEDFAGAGAVDVARKTDARMLAYGSLRHAGDFASVLDCGAERVTIAELQAVSFEVLIERLSEYGYNGEPLRVVFVRQKALGAFEYEVISLRGLRE